MAINTLATATIFQTTLDQIAVQEAKTGWMDANSGQVVYNGGAEVKVPKISLVAWQTMTETMDTLREA